MVHISVFILIPLSMTAGQRCVKWRWWWPPGSQWALCPLPSVSQSLDAGAWLGDSGRDMCFHPKERQSNGEARQDLPIRTIEDPTSCWASGKSLASAQAPITDSVLTCHSGGYNGLYTQIEKCETIDPESRFEEEHWWDSYPETFQINRKTKCNTMSSLILHGYSTF